ncbi:hypothetical protein CYY_001884 [Polysphondylium violaceum]|uniref:Uncharacterized protein n=1 Tax=Polysphondylium violaceum TaxID=133409 RepID=A0A8J4Q148_9MYCE|nr:hypothetical protein CYY_001884 [Polysphondylium violaceum]
MTDLFYLIWRNSFIQRIIRNINCRDLVISVNTQYLNDNHRYLSLFTNQEKMNNNISIRFDEDSFQNFINNQYKSIVNELDFCGEKYLLSESIDFNQIHDGVTSLSFRVKEGLTCIGKLPSSLTYLSIFDYDQTPSPVVHDVLSNLPSNLKTLVINNYYWFSSDYVLPETLTELDIKSTYDILQRFLVTSNKVLQNCKLVVRTMEALQWLHQNKWINNIVFDDVDTLALTENQIPSHVTSITIYKGTIKNMSVLPAMLESLSCSFGTAFTHLRHLKILHIAYYPIILRPNVLPPSLQEMNITYVASLLPDALPPHLTTLFLNRYNQPLCVGVLPNSLTELYLEGFNQPLNGFVLPNSLKVLYMQSFNQRILPQDSLPASLVELSIQSFRGTFEPSCQPLDNLQVLNIGSLDASLATLLKNVKRVKISANSITDATDGTCLYNTSIESLHLVSLTNQSTLYPKSFPPTTKYLTLTNVDIQSASVIPDTCVYLKSSQKIDPTFIPKSVNYRSIG